MATSPLGRGGSMQYFGKGPGFAEHWLSTQTGGGGGGSKYKNWDAIRRSVAPILISCFITVQICPTPRVIYSNLGNMSLMRAVCIWEQLIINGFLSEICDDASWGVRWEIIVRSSLINWFSSEHIYEGLGLYGCGSDSSMLHPVFSPAFSFARSI